MVGDFLRRASGCAGVLALVVAPAAWPQEDASRPAAKADDGGPRAATPEAVARTPSIYRSAFEGYRVFTPDEPLGQWRAANEAVRQAGGHMGLMKAEGQGGAKGDGHAGHSPQSRPAKDGKP